MELLSSLSAESGVEIDVLKLALRSCLSGGIYEIESHHITSALVESDERLGRQLDEIYHAAPVQSLESHWRQLKYVVEHVDYSGGRVQTEILSCSKEELLDDFIQSPEISYSGLYRVVYSLGAGLYGGVPYGLICSLFEFGPGVEDVTLLRNFAAVAAVSHAPFIGNVAPGFFGLDTWKEFNHISDLESLLEGPRFVTWQQFRESQDARYVGLCLPKFLLRRPHSLRHDPHMRLRYHEAVDDELDLVWGSASILFTVIAASSFAKYRWCVFLAGARAGSAAPLLKWYLESFDGVWARCPLELQLTVRSERVLADNGFIGALFERQTFSATMLSTPSQIKAKPLRERVVAEEDIGTRLGAQLNYMLLVCRLAHYIKVIQQQRVGQGLGRLQVERELKNWLRKYVADMEDADVEVMASRPFRRAEVRVEEVPGQTGWYRCRLELRPHLTHNSASFTLSLVGMLEQSSTTAAEIGVDE